MKIPVYHSSLLSISLLFLASCNSNIKSPSHEQASKNPTPVAQTNKSRSESEIDKKINKLLSEMSVEEKAGQLTLFTSDMDATGPVQGSSNNENLKKLIAEGKVGSVFNAYTPAFTRELQKLAVEKSPRGIPLIFGYDVIHGHRTIFPIPLAESSTWDLELIQKTARLATKEAAADGIHWSYAPMVDIARDPRWGRIAEGAGEDTWLGSKIATARVKGIQGDSLLSDESNIACVKHYAAYGAALGGRDYNTVNLSEIELKERYLPTYKAAVDAGAASIRTSFNDINGVPSTSNEWLLKKLLKEDWKFKGFVVTDYTSINELIPHGVAKDSKEAAYLAFRAGVEMDMQGGLFLKHIPELLNEGRISMSELDKAVRRVLEAKFKFGLFDNPYKNCDEEKAKEVIGSKEMLEHSSDVARKSVVLLKNSSSALPIKPDEKQVVALIGPLAANKRDQIGNWSAAGDWSKAVSLKQGMEDFVQSRQAPVTLLYAKGSNLLDESKLRDFLNTHGGNIEVDGKYFQTIVQEAQTAIKKFFESSPYNSEDSLENVDELNNAKSKLNKLIANIQASIDNKVGGVDVKKLETIIDYVKETKANLEKLLETRDTRGALFFKKLKSLKVEIDVKNPNELLQEALKVAEQANTTILALGESQGMSGEAGSRSQIRIPENQKILMRAIAKQYSEYNSQHASKNVTKKKLVLVVYSGRPLVLEEEDTLCDSVVQAWFLGSEAGHALADVLFGAHNPSGKLTVSFPYNEGQIGTHNYDQKNTGRPATPFGPVTGPWVGPEGQVAFDKYYSQWLEIKNEALYPFGWGLSYTSFEYSELKLSSQNLEKNGKIQVTVNVKNTGPLDGEEVVQLYIRDLVGSLTRPLKELKNFKKVFIKRGESVDITFDITIDDLKFVNADLEWVAEEGDFAVMVGGNSRELKSQATFTLK